MFLLVSVILYTEGVCLSACWDTSSPWSMHHHPLGSTPQKHTPSPPRSTQTPPEAHIPQEAHIPPGSRLRHTVNERPVRILLECILVCCCKHICCQHWQHWQLCINSENLDYVSITGRNPIMRLFSSNVHQVSPVSGQGSPQNAMLLRINTMLFPVRSTYYFTLCKLKISHY